MSEASGDVGEPEVGLSGGSHSGAVRVGRTVRRRGGLWSASVLELLQHLEREGFHGAPRALGFDEQGRARMKHFSDHLSELAAAGSEWEVQLARRGVLDELKSEMAWVERHAAELLEP